MKIHYFSLVFCSLILIGGYSDSNSPEKKSDERNTGSASQTRTAASRFRIEPGQFTKRFNQCMEKLGQSFRMEDTPKIKVGPNQDTFQSNPTHQITIIGTVDKKSGYVVNAMLVARGNDEQGMENIIVHATGMAVGYEPEIIPAQAKKDISRLVAAYNPHKDEPISMVYKGLKLTYGMQADMGLSHFSIRPVEQ